MGNPIDIVKNPMKVEQEYCSKCKLPLLAKNTVTKEEVCMNEKCENYNSEFIKRAFHQIK